MSRIGKRPVAIPSGVEAKIDNGILSVKGPKGTLTMGLSDLVSYKLEDGTIAVDPVNDTKPARSHWGMQRTLVQNLEWRLLLRQHIHGNSFSRHSSFPRCMRIWRCPACLSLPLL